MEAQTTEHNMQQAGIEIENKELATKRKELNDQTIKLAEQSKKLSDIQVKLASQQSNLEEESAQLEKDQENVVFIVSTLLAKEREDLELGRAQLVRDKREAVALRTKLAKEKAEVETQRLLLENKKAEVDAVVARQAGDREEMEAVETKLAQEFQEMESAKADLEKEREKLTQLRAQSDVSFIMDKLLVAKNEEVKSLNGVIQNLKSECEREKLTSTKLSSAIKAQVKETKLAEEKVVLAGKETLKFKNKMGVLEFDRELAREELERVLVQLNKAQEESKDACMQLTSQKELVRTLKEEHAKDAVKSEALRANFTKEKEEELQTLRAMLCQLKSAQEGIRSLNHELGHTSQEEEKESHPASTAHSIDKNEEMDKWVHERVSDSSISMLNELYAKEAKRFEASPPQVFSHAIELFEQVKTHKKCLTHNEESDDSTEQVKLEVTRAQLALDTEAMERLKLRLAKEWEALEVIKYKAGQNGVYAELFKKNVIDTQLRQAEALSLHLARNQATSTPTGPTNQASKFEVVKLGNVAMTPVGYEPTSHQHLKNVGPETGEEKHSIVIHDNEDKDAEAPRKSFGGSCSQLPVTDIVPLKRKRASSKEIEIDMSVTLKGHSGTIICVALSPNQRYVASGNDIGDFWIWTLEKEKCLSVYKVNNVIHKFAVRNILFSEDSRTLVTSGDHTVVYVWDVGSRAQQPRHKFSVHTKFVSAVCLRGNRLFSSGLDHMLIMWDLNTGERHQNPAVSETLFSLLANDTHLFGGGLKNVSVLNIVTGDLILRFEGHSCMVHSLHATSEHLFSGSLDGTLRIWSIKTGSCLNCINVVDKSDPLRLRSVHFHGFLAFCRTEKGNIIVWDLSKPEFRLLVFQDALKNFKCVCISSDGQRMVTGCNEHSVQLWTITEKNIS